jgi:hypothetical protein
MENLEQDDESSRLNIVKWVIGATGAAAVSVAFWYLWNTSPFDDVAAEKNPLAQRGAKRPETPPVVGESPPVGPSGNYVPTPVPTNRAGDVPPAFRGEIHPILSGDTSLEVAADWTEVGRGRDHLDSAVPASVYALFTDLKPAAASQLYTERDFSRLLPETIGSVGQIWEISPDDVAKILRQFHPQPAMHLISLGRRAGPDGAFGLLRAVSAKHLDILFRFHAEFDIAQNMWYTPACFWGRMIVDKESGTVESFRLWLPTDQPLNVHLTVAESTPRGGTQPAIFRTIQQGDRVENRRDIVHVDRMELTSANPQLGDELDWTESIDMEAAHRELKKAFYAFASINWTPWESALIAAREQRKPILAIVLWGALDDQSC